MTEAISAALIITFLNAAAALIIIKTAYKRKSGSFNTLVFGSMTVRYFVMAGLVFVCLGILDLEPLSFSLTFLIMTFILIMAEVIYLHKSQMIKQKNNSPK